MTGTTHREVALATSLAVGVSHLALTQSIFTPTLGTVLVPMLWIPMSAAGGYLPDIDKKNTTAYKWFRKYHWFFYLFIALSLFVLPWYLAAGFLVTFLVFEVMVLKSVHRRETHSLLFLASLTGVFYFLSTLLQPLHYFAYIVVFNLLLGLILGALTHAFADMFNKRRVHFLFPLETILASKDRPRFILPHLGKIVTGTADELSFKIRWFLVCGIATLALVVPSIISFIGVNVMLLSEVVIIIAVIVVIGMLWKFITGTIKIALTLIVALVIAYLLVVNLLPGFEHLNFLRSIF